MADVRGKFKVTRVSYDYWNPNGAEVILSAQYSNSPEDQTYAAATPSAEIRMSITNLDAIAKLPMGGEFYVDFTAVPPPAQIPVPAPAAAVVDDTPVAATPDPAPAAADPAPAAESTAAADASTAAQ